MSDEEHEHHGHLPFHMLQIGPTPEELEQMRMQGVANGHENVEFLESLTEKQLRHVSAMLKQTVDTEGDAGNYYVGLISGLLQYKHKICLVCGVNHDSVLSEMAAHPARECCNSLDDEPHRGHCTLMQRYGMEINDDGGREVMCSNCNQWYLSLEDRMLKPVGTAGCPGCVQKEKWG